MPKRSVKPVSKVVNWLSNNIVEPNSLSNSFTHYEKFQFENIVAELGDFVLVSNADAAEPDTEDGCDPARIVSLYEDSTNKNDPYRAKVQWYSRPCNLPDWSLKKMDVNFLDAEVIEDHRPFNTDVSIETFFRKCMITFTYTKDTNPSIDGPFHYICRYRLMSLNKRKVQIEPVKEEERRALQLLCTPAKNMSSNTTVTPKSLVKRMSRISLSEQKNWNVSITSSTKILLKRAILTDNTDKVSPKQAVNKTPKRSISETPMSEKVITMKLKENSDGGIPTLIITQHEPTNDKRKPSIIKASEKTPNKTPLFDDKTYTRSARRITKTPKYYEEEVSPVKRTVRKTRKSDSDNEFKLTPRRYEDTSKKTVKKGKKMSESDEDFKPAPKTLRTSVTPARSPKKSVSRKIISQLTPTLQSRSHAIDSVGDFVKDDKSLPGRESQMDEILLFVKSKLLDGTSGCMYISGVPGTGKTATVCSVLEKLKDDVDLPEFQLVEVNGMKISEPRQAYVQIYKQLTGKTVVWEQACTLLEKRFTNPGPRRTPTVLLVDELDALCTRRQEVLYSIMEWAAHNTAVLTVLTIANTMDLPERALAARVASRLGLTRVTFPPYTHTQLQTIVATRLAGANVTRDAVQLIARKVAAVSGDARRALSLCTRALELAGPGGAGLGEVERALAEAAGGVFVTAIKHCSGAEKLMLKAVAAEVERTGSDETTLSRALSNASAFVALEGRPYRSAQHIRPPTSSQALAICYRLASQRLLLLEPKPGDPKIMLNVSVDDVHYATRQIAAY